MKPWVRYSNPQQRNTTQADYDEALENFRAKSRAFREKEKEYRARKIGDSEYLAARAKFNAAQKELDEVENAYTSNS